MCRGALRQPRPTGSVESIEKTTMVCTYDFFLWFFLTQEQYLALSGNRDFVQADR